MRTYAKAQVWIRLPATTFLPLLRATVLRARAAKLRLAIRPPLACADAIGTLARAASIVERVLAHGLRHTHASELRSEGLDIGLISRQLGHADISTTARYLDHINLTAVIQAMGKRAW